MTKRETFVAMLDVLTDEAHIAFVKHEIELLDKRAAKGRGMTPAQKENEVLKETIVEVLEGADEGATATDVANVLEVSVQKASQLLRQLVAAGDVIRTEGKGKTKTTFAV